MVVRVVVMFFIFELCSLYMLFSSFFLILAWRWASLIAALRAFFSSVDSSFRRTEVVAMLGASLSPASELEEEASSADASLQMGRPVLRDRRMRAFPPAGSFGARLGSAMRPGWWSRFDRSDSTLSQSHRSTGLSSAYTGMAGESSSSSNALASSLARCDASRASSRSGSPLLPGIRDLCLSINSSRIPSNFPMSEWPTTSSLSSSSSPISSSSYWKASCSKRSSIIVSCSLRSCLSFLQ
mmetsp:Transcript_12431/g.34891  ORF Transcript_12431/g.34891 Transcript_12431/m.34891 type:complete len:240 (+) Transcript_12431:259-978(+)